MAEDPVEQRPSTGGNLPAQLRGVRRRAARMPGAGLSRTVPHTVRFFVDARIRQLRSRSSADRPVARPSWSMAGQVALDEAVLGLVSATRLPHRADYERAGAEVLEAGRLWAERGWIANPASYHATPPALVDVVSKRRRSRGLNFEQVSFESGYAPHAGEPGGERWQAHGPNQTAQAWVLRHRGPPRPWLVCLHGMGMGSPLVDFEAFKAARLYRERGLNVLFPVLPLHGPRRTGRGRSDGFPGFDQMDLIHGLAQALWDIRRLVGWVKDQDAPAIAAHGISLGGYATALVVAYEPRVTSAIAGIPVVDFPRLTHHHANRQQRRRGFEHQLLGDGIDRLHRVVSPLAVPPLLPPDRLAVYAGIGDRMVTPGQAEMLWKHWQRPAICWFPGSHVTAMWSDKANRFLGEVMDREGLFGLPSVRSGG